MLSFSSSQKKNKKQLKKLICSFLSSQGYCSPAFSQPLGAGHPQRLSHVRQYGLDRPVAPRCRRSHGGFARGSAGLWTGEKHTWGWCTERTGNLEQTQIKTKKQQQRGMAICPYYRRAALFENSALSWYLTGTYSARRYWKGTQTHHPVQINKDTSEQ